MSFAEKNNKQGVVLIDINESATMERLFFDAPVRLLSIPGEPLPLTEVLDAIAELSDGEITETSPYLEVKVLITEPEPSLRFQIETALQTKNARLVRIAAVTPKRDTEAKVITYDELQTIEPMDMATMIYKGRYGDEMPETMKKLLLDVIQEIER